MTSQVVAKVDDPEDSIAEAAAEWSVLLTSDDSDERENAFIAYEKWKSADPRHAEAALRIQKFMTRVNGFKGNSMPANAVLNKVLSASPKRRSRSPAVILALILSLSLPAWFAVAVFEPSTMTADIRTNAEQWTTRILPDDTRLTLSSDSAVNLRFDKATRTIELVKGEILLEVARDLQRPFIVETEHGSVRALGTQFVVKQRSDAAFLSMIESKVFVQSSSQISEQRGHGTVVIAGQSAKISNNSVQLEGAIDPESLSSAWAKHQLVVNDEPLSKVLEEIGRHRRGMMYFDEHVLENIRITAVLPLDDTNLALQLLQNNYPGLRIRMITPYFAMVDMPPTR